MVNGFMKGALIGGVLAGVAGLMLAPKSGTLLLKDIMDAYESAQKNGHDFIETIKEKGSKLTHWGEEEECDSHYSLLAGCLLGAVVAGIAALLLAPDSGKKLRKVLGRQYEDAREKAEEWIASVEKNGSYALDEVNNWKDTLAGLINKLSQNKTHGKQHYNLDQILNLAQIGLRLYQQAKK